MNDYAHALDMRTQADLLLATREDLEKCKLKVSDITDLAIDKLYAEAASHVGIQPRDAFSQLVLEMKNIIHFQTGDDELDKYLGNEGLSSDEIIEVCGASASGKTYFCLKLAALAMLDSSTNEAKTSDVCCLYVDTTNYVNGGNVGLVLRNFMSQCSSDEKESLVEEILNTRFKIQKCFTLEKLLITMAHLVSLLKKGELKMNLRLIVVDSLSSLFAGITPKNHAALAQAKELLQYFKILTKKYFIGIVFTNNTKDAYVTRVSDLKNLVGEPMSWAVDKQIYAAQSDGQTNYVITKH